MWLQAYGLSKTLLCFGRRGLFVFPLGFNTLYVRSLDQCFHVRPFNFILYVREEGQSVAKVKMKSGNTHISRRLHQALLQVHCQTDLPRWCFELHPPSSCASVWLTYLPRPS